MAAGPLTPEGSHLTAVSTEFDASGRAGVIVWMGRWHGPSPGSLHQLRSCHGSHSPSPGPRHAGAAGSTSTALS